MTTPEITIQYPAGTLLKGELSVTVTRDPVSLIDAMLDASDGKLGESTGPKPLENGD
jgi:hypothetical protein